MQGDDPSVFSYENCKGVTYFLHEGRTKTGKPRYFFARSVREGARTTMPEGYAVGESANGVVSVRKRRPGQATIPASDLARVQAELRRHERLRYHRVTVDDGAIVIHRPNVDAAELRSALERIAVFPWKVEECVSDHMRRSARYSPELRFVRTGSDYEAHRMTYRGDGGWSWPLRTGPLETLVGELVSTLGTVAFFELL